MPVCGVFGLASLPRPLGAAFACQPLTCSAVLEAALREEQSGRWSAVAYTAEHTFVLLRFVQQVAVSTFTEQQEGHMFAEHPTTVQCEAGAAAAGAKTQQLFALLLTCLKVAAVAWSYNTSRQQLSSMQIELNAAHGVHICTAIMKAGLLYMKGLVPAVQQSGGSVSSDSSSSTAGQLLLTWIVLLGRALHQLGNLLCDVSRIPINTMTCEELADTHPYYPVYTFPPVLAVEIWSRTARALGQVVEPQLLSDEHIACASSTRHSIVLHAQQLLQSMQEAQNALENAMECCQQLPQLTQEPSSAAEATRALQVLCRKVGADLAQPLQQLGEHICAQLPVQYCCNNPHCTNLQKCSELQLVGGKGSRCSGCKVCYYCSASCQQSHWKQHKPICRLHRQS